MPQHVQRRRRDDGLVSGPADRQRSREHAAPDTDRRRNTAALNRRTALQLNSVQAALSAMLATLDRRRGRSTGSSRAARAWAELERPGPGRVAGYAWMDTVIDAPDANGAGDDAVARVTLTQGIAAVRARMAAALGAAGVPPDDAIPLATLAVSAYEGASVQGRVGARVEALRQSGAALLEMIRPYLRRRGASAYADTLGPPSSQFSSNP